MSPALTFSVIIPTLNEAQAIGRQVAAVRALAPAAQVIVADGGSADGTPAAALAAGAEVVAAPRGRGPQLNAGAALASGEVLVFLHADTALPEDAFPLIAGLFCDPAVQVAKFRLRFDSDDPLLALAARAMWLDSDWTSFGDQTMVMRRSFFRALGAFPDWPLFEDVRLFQLARERAPVHTLPAEVTTSARRFRRNGPLRQLLADVGLMTRYLLGADPRALAAEYEARRHDR